MHGRPRRALMPRIASAWRSALSRLSIMQVPPMNTNGRPPPMRSGPTVTSRPMPTWRATRPSGRRAWRRRSVRRAHDAEQRRLAGFRLVLQRRADEALEQRVTIDRARLELGMELAADEPRVVGELDDLDQGLVR